MFQETLIAMTFGKNLFGFTFCWKTDLLTLWVENEFSILIIYLKNVDYILGYLQKLPKIFCRIIWSISNTEAKVIITQSLCYYPYWVYIVIIFVASGADVEKQVEVELL